jgi:hypothetical protein
MLQSTRLLLLLVFALTWSVAAASSPALAPPRQASLHDDLTRVAVVLAVRVSAWAVSSTVAGFAIGSTEEAGEAPAARVRPEPNARPLMPFYSFASVLPRARGG